MGENIDEAINTGLQLVVATDESSQSNLNQYIKQTDPKTSDLAKMPCVEKYSSLITLTQLQEMGRIRGPPENTDWPARVDVTAVPRADQPETLWYSSCSKGTSCSNCKGQVFTETLIVELDYSLGHKTRAKTDDCYAPDGASFECRRLFGGGAADHPLPRRASAADYSSLQFTCFP